MAKLGDPTDFSYRIDKVLKVVDGDTIDVRIDMGFDIKYKSRVRLFGIDTPESRTRNLAEKSWGMAAKHRLIELLAEADGKFTLHTEEMAKGKFGRVLGTIVVNGRDANQEVPHFHVHILAGENLKGIR